MRQRVHILDAVTCRDVAVDGSLRTAQSSDLELAAEWAASFFRETGVDGNAQDLTSRLVRDRSLYLWQDGKPRSMAAAIGATQHGVRIGYVYTPPSCRGCGYATAAVTALSRLLLERGREFCCLYTDLANPTSNAIYQRIGYRRVCDVVDANITRCTTTVPDWKADR
jgi:predicted GNAT family acetyltransferase